MITPTPCSAPPRVCAAGWTRSAQRLALLLVSAAFTFAADQTAGTITGRVSNAATGAYLESATISVEGTRVQTATARGGEFTDRKSVV